MFRHGTSVTKLARGLLIAYRLRGVTLGTARSKTSFSGGDVKQCRLVWISKFLQAKDDLLKGLEVGDLVQGWSLQLFQQRL